MVLLLLNIVSTWLTGMGTGLVFIGLAWILMMTRHGRLVTTKNSVSKKTIPRISSGNDESDTLPGDSLGDDPVETDDLFSGFSKRKRTSSMRGVEAIFTPPALTRARWNVSRTMIIGLLEVACLILLYAGLVTTYSSNLAMRTWIHMNLGVAAYLLNYDMVLVVTGLVGILAFSLVVGGKTSSKKRFRARVRRNRRRRD